jgi:hypothetical protein
MAKRVKHDLVAMVHLVKGLLASLPEYNAQHPEPHRAAERTVRQGLEARGARFAFVYGSEQMTFAGVRATSSSGVAGAMANWVKAAYRKMDRASLKGSER